MENMCADEFKQCIGVKIKMLLRCWAVFQVYQNTELSFWNYLWLKKNFQGPQKSVLYLAG